MPDLVVFLSLAGYSILLGCTLTLAAIPYFGVLQQEGYAGGAFLRFCCRRANTVRRRYLLLALCDALAGVLLPVIFLFAGGTLALAAAVIAMCGFHLLFFFANRRALKVPLARTPRAVRLSVASVLLIEAVYFGLQTGLAYAAYAIGRPLAVLLVSAPLSLLPTLLPLAIAAANAVMKLYEIPHGKKFIRRAKKALSKSSCIKVGVTGSFGKTTVKRFCAHLLAAKYRVLATPASYNTPLGIARCVNENGLDCDVFLAEMGARKRGDIAELIELVAPQYGVLTGVCAQHVETFGSLEAIKREKGLLVQAARCAVGESAKELAGEDSLVAGRDFAAKNVVLSQDGVAFDLVLGEDKFFVKAPLLGRHVAEDAALAAALCVMLGVEKEDVAAKIATLPPVPHRLERMDSGGVVILDDSYNSNVEGAKDALEVLRLFGGKRYVVTPGLVELGNLEEKENAALGAQLIGLEVILVGETLVLPVRRGYLEAGGDAARLRIVPTLSAAQQILQGELTAGDAVLFLNDLPDKYNR